MIRSPCVRDHQGGAARIVAVSEDETAEAVRLYFTATHNLAEGVGAAPLAALMQEKERYAGGRVGLSCPAAISTWRRWRKSARCDTHGLNR